MIAEHLQRLHVGMLKAAHSIEPMRRGTGEERSIFCCAIKRLTQEVAHRAQRYNEAYQANLKQSIIDRRRREMLQAAEQLAIAYSTGTAEDALRHLGREKAVRERERAPKRCGELSPQVSRGRSVDSVAFYRREAAMCRIQADDMPPGEHRQRLRSLAKHYEEQARVAERLKAETHQR
jgi:hypothetical protein